DDDLRVRSIRLVGPEHVVAGFPESGAGPGVWAPFEWGAAQIPQDVGKTPGLLFGGGLAFLELQEKSRLNGKIELGVGIADRDLLFIDQLDTRQRYACLNGHDGRVACSIDAREAADATSNRLWNWM